MLSYLPLLWSLVPDPPAFVQHPSLLLASHATPNPLLRFVVDLVTLLQQRQQLWKLGAELGGQGCLSSMSLSSELLLLVLGVGYVMFKGDKFI